MDKVISFPKAKPPEPSGEYCLKCGACGCTTFYALDNGEVECAICKVRPQNGWWTPTSVPQRHDDDTLAAQVIKTNDFAKSRTIQRAKEDGCVLIIAVQASGIVTTWFNEDMITDEHAEWVEDKISTARSMLQNEPIVG